MKTTLLTVIIVMTSCLAFAGRMQEKIISRNEMNTLGVSVVTEKRAEFVSFKITWKPRIRDKEQTPGMYVLFMDAKSGKVKFKTKYSYNSRGFVVAEFTISADQVRSVNVILKGFLEYHLSLSDYMDGFKVYGGKTP